MDALPATECRGKPVLDSATARCAHIAYWTPSIHHHGQMAPSIDGRTLSLQVFEDARRRCSAVMPSIASISTRPHAVTGKMFCNDDWPTRMDRT